jgi:hypothetical protein
MVMNGARARDLGTQNPIRVGIWITKSNEDVTVLCQRFGGEKSAAVEIDILDIGSVRVSLSKEFLSLERHGQMFVEGAVRLRDTHLNHLLESGTIVAKVKSNPRRILYHRGRGASSVFLDFLTLWSTGCCERRRDTRPRIPISLGEVVTLKGLVRTRGLRGFQSAIHPHRRRRCMAI